MTRKQYIPCSGMYASCGWGQQDKRPRIVILDTEKGAFFKEIIMSAFARFTKACITILYSVHNIGSSLARTWCYTQFWILVVLMLSFRYQVRPEVPYLVFSLINSFRNIRLGFRFYRFENQAKMVPWWSVYVIPQPDSIEYGCRWWYSVPSFIVGAIIGPFGAKLINVSQWGGDTDNASGEIGDIAYVSRFAAKQNTKLIILGTNSVGDWHRYGQSRLRATETIHSASSGRTHHLPTAIDDNSVADDVGMYQINDP